MSVIFFQKFWSIVGSSIIKSSLHVLNCGVSPISLNHTYIALIPKKPKCPTEFRAISLCNVAFKVITKDIANRLKVFLPTVVDPAQSACIPCRLITDNTLLTYEIFHSIKHNKTVSKGSFAFKLDMSKAYDRVEWVFLENVMLKLGICVRSVSFAVLVNGQPSSTFLPSRGLRQGDPISPYLFVLCVEALSAIIRRNVERGRLHRIRIYHREPVVSLLIFADDKIIFGCAFEVELGHV